MSKTARLITTIVPILLMSLFAMALYAMWAQCLNHPLPRYDQTNIMLLCDVHGLRFQRDESTADKNYFVCKAPKGTHFYILKNEIRTD